MQTPSTLYRLETDTGVADLRAGTLVVALRGFLDAGHAQRLLVEHLLRTLEHTVVATFDVDQLLDYRARRPVMTFSRDRYTAYSDPCLALYRIVDDAGTPFFLLWGPEPDYQWERMSAAVVDLVERLSVQLVVSIHGIPMAVPHTRPVTSTLHGTTDEVRAGAQPVFGTVEIPGSLAALLELRLGEQGHAATGFAVHVPHYLAQSDFPAGAAHALERLADAAGLSLPPAALELAAADSAHAIASEVAESAEAAEIVRALEEQYDARLARLAAGDDHVNDEDGGDEPDITDGPLPTGDQLGAELEAFLEEIRRGRH
ncbi:PAC2 family protein [Mobilicoccus sp.]|uniref:PAC2 family protein n=1 Tax=Mobilicoccus sp. TaxID=2034349 RepID=UPI0028A2C54A|nr:PAC2 family protein [Mobilicoccus sp.]